MYQKINFQNLEFKGIFDLYIFLQMAQPQNRNNNDLNLNDRQNAVSERLEALEAKNRMLKEEIALLKSAKRRHYLLIGLLFYMLVPVPILSGAIYLCVTNGDPWFMVIVNIICPGAQLLAAFCRVMIWILTANQEMCDPLRELLEMAEAQEEVRRELRQEEEAIRRALERRRYQEQIRRQLREMAGRGRDSEDEEVAQCPICLEQFNLYADLDMAILVCKHIFHRACIELWLPHKDTCPVCRRKIDSNYLRRITVDDVDED